MSEMRVISSVRIGESYLDRFGDGGKMALYDRVPCFVQDKKGNALVAIKCHENNSLRRIPLEKWNRAQFQVKVL